MHVLEDSEGKVVRSVSEVEEKDGKLWMGDFFHIHSERIDP
jgi:hypothetical protein